MKIKKVDDKPMVIHTKEKAKIHAHEPKEAKIKGSNIYTVERGPKTIGATTMYVCTVSFPVQGLFLTIRSGRERKTSFSGWKSCGISSRVNFSQDCSHSFKTDSCIF